MWYFWDFHIVVNVITVFDKVTILNLLHRYDEAAISCLLSVSRKSAENNIKTRFSYEFGLFVDFRAADGRQEITVWNWFMEHLELYQSDTAMSRYQWFDSYSTSYAFEVNQHILVFFVKCDMYYTFFSFFNLMYVIRTFMFWSWFLVLLRCFPFGLIQMTIKPSLFSQLQFPNDDDKV